MKYLKTIFVATILLNGNVTFDAEYSAYTQEEPVKLEEQATQTEAVTPASIQENTKEITAIESWNNHLTILAEQGEYWNVSSNIPTDSWKEQAITLAKAALNTDKTIAESIKSAFFNAITAKVKQENGEFTASTYALIKAFDDTIDEYIKTLTPTEPEPTPEETKPVVEPTPTPIETAPTPPAEEKINQPEITPAPATEKPQDITQEWNNIIERIKTEGKNSSEIKDLLYSAYNLAGKLWIQGLMDENSLQFDFEYAITKHNQNLDLLFIDLKKAIEAFNQETGIPIITYDQETQELQKQYAQAMKKQDEQQQARTKELKNVATVQKAMQQANIPEADMQRLNRQLEERLALHEADRVQEQAFTQAELQRIKQELTNLRKIKKEKAQEEPGVLETMKRWWYGEPEKLITKEDINARHFKTIKESSQFKSLPDYTQEQIITDWNQFIEKLKSTPQLSDITKKETHELWLKTIEKFLRDVTITYNIISIQEACDIIEDNLEPSSYRTQIIREIKKYLEDEKYKIIQAKEQKEAAKLKRAQQRQEKKELAMLEQQKIKDEKNRIEEERQKQLLRKQAYENTQQEWKNLLIQLRQDATEEENRKNTKKAAEIAKSLMLLTSPEKRKDLEQELKNEFTKAIVAQPKVNNHETNIQGNLTTFYNDLHKITESFQ